MCEYRHEHCQVEKCNIKHPKNCGLYCFLKDINNELKSYPEEKPLIESLKGEIIGVWKNTKKESVAIGRATGEAFADWILEKAGLNSKSKERKNKKVKFGPITFTVDYVIPSPQNPKVILEIKRCSDIQHTLALKGLLDYSPPDWKLGYIAFKEREDSEVLRLLKRLKNEYIARFDYFIIAGPNGWSKAIEKLKVFCNIITN